MYSAFIFAQPNIVYAEYFFDTDPGFGSGTSIAIAAFPIISTTITPDVTALNEGLHTAHVRTKDANGAWSQTYNHFFFKVTANDSLPNIVAAEYFFDTDPDFGNGTAIAITPGKVITASLNPDVTALTDGLHQLYIRAKDVNGAWSHTHIHSFFKATTNDTLPNIVAAEYFFDTDPGFGNGTAIAIAPAKVITASLNPDVTALTDGVHELYIRTRDANGVWSHTYIHSFFKVTTHDSLPNIVAAEYFFDTDPGVGNGTAIAIAPGKVVTASLNPDVTALGDGLHELYIRTQDANGAWSHTYIHYFFKNEVFPQQPNIIAAEYFFDADPGFGNANSLPVVTGKVIVNNNQIDVTGLATGTHFLYIRTLDDLGAWSHAYIHEVDIVNDSFFLLFD